MLLAPGNLVAATWGGVCAGAFVQPQPLFCGLVKGGGSEDNTGIRWDLEKILEDLEQVQKENSSRTSWRVAFRGCASIVLWSEMIWNEL